VQCSLLRFRPEHAGTIGLQEQTLAIPLHGRDLSSSQVVSCALEVSEATSILKMDVAQSVTCRKITQGGPSFKSIRSFEISRSRSMENWRELVAGELDTES
jgi:hypothetical protein